MSLWAVDVSGKVIVKRRRSMLRVYADSKEEAEEKAKRSFIEKQKIQAHWLALKATST